MDIQSYVGLLTVSLFIGASQSLKDKRMVIKSIKDKVAARFNVSVAELDGHEDKWQTSTLAFAIVSADSGYIERSLNDIMSLIEKNYDDVEITDREIEFF
jgi:uncharacterized protein